MIKWPGKYFFCFLTKSDINKMTTEKDNYTSNFWKIIKKTWDVKVEFINFLNKSRHKQSLKMAQLLIVCHFITKMRLKHSLSQHIKRKFHKFWNKASLMVMNIII